MRISPFILVLIIVVGFFGCKRTAGTNGAQLFSLHCASCHPSGGNTINPNKTLRRNSLYASNIRTPGDIVEKMRNPGAGMPRFSPAVIPDSEAALIAEHVLETFR